MQKATELNESQTAENHTEAPASRQQKNLNIRCNPATFDKYANLRKQRGLETNEALLESLMQDNEQVAILKRQLGEQAAKTKVVEKAVESVKYENYVRMTLAVPKTLMPVIGKLRESMKAQGYNNIPLSAAVNLCVLHFVYDAQRFSFKSEEFEMLDAFLKSGPEAIDGELLQGFVDKEFRLESE